MKMTLEGGAEPAKSAREGLWKKIINFLDYDFDDGACWVLPNTLDPRAYDPRYSVEDAREYALGGGLQADFERLAEEKRQTGQ